MKNRIDGVDRQRAEIIGRWIDQNRVITVEMLERIENESFGGFLIRKMFVPGQQERWFVLDYDEEEMGDGETVYDAIQSAYRKSVGIPL